MCLRVIDTPPGSVWWDGVLLRCFQLFCWQRCPDDYALSHFLTRTLPNIDSHRIFRSDIRSENPDFFSMTLKISCTFPQYYFFLKRRKTTNNCGPALYYYADNFFLPFNLLAAKTFLPPALLILLRKPWTLDLCLFFGWNVIFVWIHLLY